MWALNGLQDENEQNCGGGGGKENSEEIDKVNKADLPITLAARFKA
jgi:hypothetical protein